MVNLRLSTHARAARRTCVSLHDSRQDRAAAVAPGAAIGWQSTPIDDCGRTQFQNPASSVRHDRECDTGAVQRRHRWLGPGFGLPLAIWLLGSSAIAHGPAVRGAQDDLSVDTIVSRATAYVRDYTQSLAFVIADEHYQQRRLRSGRVLEERLLEGELFLTFLPDTGEWMAIHDVARVDGQPVDDRRDLRLLLAGGASPADLGRRLAAENARHNIGGVMRNFNDPLLPLLVLHDDRVESVRFDRQAIDRTDGRTVATLRFREGAERTIVRSARGARLRASGTITLDADTGTILRTTFAIDDNPVSAELETEYRWDEHLGLQVPSIFREEYLDRRPDPMETIACEAQYTNFRRFEVRSRIR